MHSPWCHQGKSISSIITWIISWLSDLYKNDYFKRMSYDTQLPICIFCYNNQSCKVDIIRGERLFLPIKYLKLMVKFNVSFPFLVVWKINSLLFFNTQIFRHFSSSLYPLKIFLPSYWVLNFFFPAIEFRLDLVYQNNKGSYSESFLYFSL